MSKVLYDHIPCSTCQSCQHFGIDEGYGATPFGCEKTFEPKAFAGYTPHWSSSTMGVDTYPETCHNFKSIDHNSNSNSNSEKQERTVNNTPRELTETDKFIFKLISFFVSGFGYVFIAWEVMYSLTGNDFSAKWIWVAGTLVLGIIIGILKAKTKRLGMILYIIGFLLIVVGFILPKVLSNS